MTTAQTFTTSIGGQEVTIETGKLAQQAGGAVTVRMGDTMLFCSATMSKHVREGMSFFPLSVDYEEKMYAAGKIPGGFFRREGRPAEGAILISRVIDRTLRPLFPDGMRNEVQIILTSLSHDQEHQVDMLGVLAASASIFISDIPWDGPVAGVRMGLIDGELKVNPSLTEMEKSDLDLRVSGTADAINMVECGAKEVDEAIVLDAMKLAKESIQSLIAVQHEMREALGKEKAEVELVSLDEAIVEAVKKRTESTIRDAFVNHTDRHDRRDILKAIETEIVEATEARNTNLPEEKQVPISDIKEALYKVQKSVVRNRITKDKVRPDGRDFVTIRPLSSEVSYVPRVHGSGLFQRGETQVLTLATLGTPRDSQLMDGLMEDNKRYIHHYNFPPYSTGETGFMRGPKRREIGHGSLAENALLPMIPEEKEFPYTLRLVSEVMSSNGSTSMASVCASTLALMDAGVPIKNPVAGIAMGLIKEGDDVAILTDIQGMEDHLGDMDFKVAGTVNGITALQMDIKITGVSDEVMEQALKQARDARLQILEVMNQAIAEPREKLSDFAPRMETFKVPVDKIGAIIGPGGKTVRSIQDSLQVTVEIADDGTVFVAGNDGPTVDQAMAKIKGLIEEAELGQIYMGKVTRIENYGAFVEFLPGKDGLVHISQLADYRVESVEQEVAVGDEVMVMVTDIDPSGRVRLSRQAVLEGWDIEEARRRDSGSRGGGNRGRGGNNRNRGRGGNNRGGGNRGRNND